MAFDFADMFPDSPAAVAASQGALNILENQHKQSLGFMEMEQALMRTAQARKQIAEQARLEPLAKTVEAVKLLQGLNLASGAEAFKGIDLNDPGSLNNTLQSAVQSGQLMTNVEAELAGKRLGAQEATARAMTMEGGRNARDASDRAADRDKQAYASAKEHFERLVKRYPKTPLPGNRKANELVTDYQGLKAMGAEDLTRAFWTKHSKLLQAANEDAPGVAARKSAKDAPQGPAQPKVFEYKGRKFQLQGGKAQEIK